MEHNVAYTGPRPPRRDPIQDVYVVEQQIDRFSRAKLAHDRWAERAKECVEFFEGKQWSDADIDYMRQQGRPPITLNKIRPLIRLLSGYFRQQMMEASFKANAMGDDAQAFSERIGHLYKAHGIKDEREFHDAMVFLDGLITGRGYWDQRLDFERNAYGDMLERRVDNFSILLDPESEYAKPTDWGFVQSMIWMSLEDIRATFGEAAAHYANDGNIQGPTTTWSSRAGYAYGANEAEVTPGKFFGQYDYLNLFMGGAGLGEVGQYRGTTGLIGTIDDHINRDRKLFRTIECQHKVRERRPHFVDLRSGEKRVIPREWDRDRINRAMMWSEMNGGHIGLQDYVTDSWRWTVTCADVVLYDEWSPYSRPTQVPYFAYHRSGQTQGLVEDLIDPQRELNKRRASILHFLMTASNSGWMYPEGSLDPQQETKLAREGGRPGLILKYNAGKGAPERIEPATPPLMIERVEERFSEDMREIAAVNSSALGQDDRVQSGRAILAKQQQTIVGAEDYFSNFQASQRWKAEGWVEAVRDNYTERRTYIIEDDEGRADELVINDRRADGMLFNSIRRWQFLVEIDARPMASTVQRAQLEDLLEAIKAAPQLGELALEPLVDALDIPAKAKEQVKQRLQMLLPPLDAGQPGGAPLDPMTALMGGAGGENIVPFNPVTAAAGGPPGGNEQ